MQRGRGSSLAGPEMQFFIGQMTINHDKPLDFRVPIWEASHATPCAKGVAAMSTASMKFDKPLVFGVPILA